MTDRPHDNNPDSLPAEADRGSIEQVDQRTEDRDDAVIDDAAPDPGNGAVGGTDGVTKNQDDTAQ